MKSAKLHVSAIAVLHHSQPMRRVYDAQRAQSGCGPISRGDGVAEVARLCVSTVGSQQVVGIASAPSVAVEMLAT